MNLSESQQKFTLNIAKLIQKAEELNIKLTFGEAFRTQDQEYLYFHGLTIGPKGTLIPTQRKSWTMNSNHLKRLAVDFNFFVNGELVYDEKNPELIALGEYWEGLAPENRWGGFWQQTPDAPHFEMNLL